MKILYITPTIYDEGGVAKVVSVKSNVLIENYNCEIGFVTFNNASTDTFHPFHSDIQKFDIKATGFKPFKILNYYQKVKKIVQSFQPDVIVICDFGWKGFFFSKFVKTTIPIVFEIHGSLFNESKKINNKTLVNYRASVRKKLLSAYNNVVFLSAESQKEWGIAGEIIPNSIQNTNLVAKLQNHKAIAIARHSYEKGIDRLIDIWAKVSQKSDWLLEIYGDGYLFEKHQNQIKELGLNETIKLLKPLKNIQEKYLEASMFVMTSRSEGFPMALLEAMEVGLPAVSYDCPIGPKAIIKNESSGFLIEDGNVEQFVSTVLALQKDTLSREKIGQQAKLEMQKLHPDVIAKKWFNYFTALISK
ncbi:glycosyltransferase family 4 protein [Flavobacterium amnicola]|uniref:Glycosyltransferase family 4 protein n=1 Tax=Flavobacterium amnicola TaxID=2506422 RepID=A0A4Q1K2K6_9FLAO|nr:glycosyltransferase [Flavobacterium amnicola]RXR19270.1 glycosyltransferase family 4 protein [Flavobacterium amnicola]